MQQVILFHDSGQAGGTQNLVTAGSLGVDDLQAALDHLPHLVREVSWQRLVEAFSNFLSQGSHVRRPERRK